MSEEYGLKFVVNGEDYDKIKKSLNEQIEDLQQKVEQLESIRKEAIVYVKDWQSYPHTTCTTHNELKNLLNILNKGDNNGRK